MRICSVSGMSTDKHYTEPGHMPQALEDGKGTDAQATKGMVAVIVIVAAILMLAVAIVYLVG